MALVTWIFSNFAELRLDKLYRRLSIIHVVTSASQCGDWFELTPKELDVEDLIVYAKDARFLVLISTCVLWAKGQPNIFLAQSLFRRINILQKIVLGILLAELLENSMHSINKVAEFGGKTGFFYALFAREFQNCPRFWNCLCCCLSRFDCPVNVINQITRDIKGESWTNADCRSYPNVTLQILTNLLADT